MKRLLFFTNAFPYSSSEPWKLNELKILAQKFDSITIAPFTALEPLNTSLPSNVEVLPPLSRVVSGPMSRWEALLLASPRLPDHIRGLLIERPKPSITNLKKWLISSIAIERVIRSSFYREQLLPKTSGTVLYFFWGTDYARLLPFLPRDVAQATAVRFHGYDLYHERSGGFLPHQGAIIERAGQVLTISAHGERYLRTRFPQHTNKIQLTPLGTEIRSLGKPSNDDVLRIVSCGYVRSEKRNLLIVEALRRVSRRVEWTHIGDGPLFDEMKHAAASLPPNISVCLRGRLSNEAILIFYEQTPIDVFVNVSSSEGLPVSIMEAMCSGIPVIATDVGGTSELVDEGTGRLLRADFRPDDLARALDEFACLGIRDRERLRENCRTRIAQHYDRDLNAHQLAQILLSLAVARS